MIIVVEQIEQAMRKECELNPISTCEPWCISLAERKVKFLQKRFKEGFQAVILVLILPLSTVVFFFTFDCNKRKTLHSVVAE